MSNTEVSTRTLIPQLAELQGQLTVLTQEAEALRSLTREQWLWSPAPNVWSLALILDHLNRAEDESVPRIEQAIETLRREQKRSDGPFRYRWSERFFIRMLSPDPPFKVPVPPSFMPKAPADPVPQVLEPFLALQARYLRLVDGANGCDLKAVKVTSPASSMVKMTVGAYLESMVAHERYHWPQVQALLSHPKFPKS